MTTNAIDAKQPLPRTTAGLERRIAEPAGAQVRLKPQGQLHTRPAPQPAPPPQPNPNPILAEAALYGIVGKAVRALAPHTEADPAGILLQLLVAFGNLVGPAPHCMVDATRHALNLFVVLVGESSKARKGTSWNLIRHLFAEVDLPWVEQRITNVRLTPASLIYALRAQQQVSDPRLLVLSEEFGAVLHSLRRSKGHLSPLLRCAWDSRDLRLLAGRNFIATSRSHVSLIAHITQRELAENLQPTDAHNGFANRCLWAAVHRSQCLPEGGNPNPQELSAVVADLRRALNWVGDANTIRLCRDEPARMLWKDCYPVLSQAHPGLYGAATSRAEAQVLRLSALYAILDSTAAIRLHHLQAALAVWNYCSESAAFFFGTATGDPITDRILETILESPTGISRTRLSALFRGRISNDRVDAALEQLIALGAIDRADAHTKGRTATIWSAAPKSDPLAEAESFLEETEKCMQEQT
jgi:hypothetical protein